MIVAKHKKQKTNTSLNQNTKQNQRKRLYFLHTKYKTKIKYDAQIIQTDTSTVLIQCKYTNIKP